MQQPEELLKNTLTGMPMVWRPGWDEWGLWLAAAVSLRGDCLRRRVGAVLLDSHHRIVGAGYNGSPPGGPSCLAGGCPRAFSGVGPGSSYDTGPGRCIALHAEFNAIVDAGLRLVRGTTMYVTETPCVGCDRLIQGSGIEKVVVLGDKPPAARGEAGGP